MIARPAMRRAQGESPRTGRNRVVQQLVYGPRLVGQPGGHRRRPLLPCAPPAGPSRTLSWVQQTLEAQPTSHRPLSTRAVPCALPRPRRVKGARCARKVARSPRWGACAVGRIDY